MSNDPTISKSSRSVEDADLVFLNDKKTPGLPQLIGCYCIVISVALAGLYLYKFSGGFKNDNFLERLEIDQELASLAESLGIEIGGVAEAGGNDPAKAGEKVFQANCMVCHQVTGQGLPGAFPPLAGSDWVGKDPGVLARIVLNGMQGPVTVSGSEYNSIMAPLGAALSDEDVANVLTYVRKAWGNDFEAVDTAVVAETRAAAGTHGMWTVPELMESMGQ